MDISTHNMTPTGKAAATPVTLEESEEKKEFLAQDGCEEKGLLVINQLSALHRAYAAGWSFLRQKLRLCTEVSIPPPIPSEPTTPPRGTEGQREGQHRFTWAVLSSGRLLEFSTAPSVSGARPGPGSPGHCSSPGSARAQQGPRMSAARNCALLQCMALRAEFWSEDTLKQMLPSGMTMGYIGFDQDFSRQTSLLY